MRTLAGRADVNGVGLYYESTGRGRPVVFVHGFGCGIRSWDPQVRALSTRYRTIAYDVRGHGLSDAPRDAAAYSQPTSVEDLRGLLAHLRIGTAAVVGLSMGGNIALNFALAHPDMVSALIVVDTGAGSDDTSEWVAGTERFAAATDAGGMEAFADMAMASPLFAEYCAQGAAAQRFIRACLMTHRARGIAHTAREVLAKRPTIYALERPLARLEVPTLLIVGERDAPCRKVHDFMARTIPGARSLVIPRIGHLSNLEAPSAFNAAVARFLAGARIMTAHPGGQHGQRARGSTRAAGRTGVGRRRR
jgi:pimeloyl-ACP methyl ester carboxylesterase